MFGFSISSAEFGASKVTVFAEMLPHILLVPKMNVRDKKAWLWAVGVCILFPLFFQLGGGIYRDVIPIVDSKGLLERLPFPISIGVYLAILVFWSGNQEKARPALAMILAALAASLVSLWLGSDSVTPPERKLIMIVQVLLPLVGLLLGQLVDDKDKIIARAFLVVISIVVPLQLLATWFQGSLILTHYLYAFSIYSHFQYVTLIFVCAFVYSLTSLWDEYKIWLCILLVPMLIYVVSGLSFLTIFAYGSFLIVFAGHKFWTYRSNTKLVLTSFALILAMAIGAGAYFLKMDGQRPSVEGKEGLFLGKFKSLLEGKVPSNVQERFGDWNFFGEGVLESKKTILLGHPQPMPRETKSSPHNWYIDIAYTFGMVGLLPTLALIGYSAYMCWRQRRTLPAQTWWLAVIVFYLVVVDSNFKVTLRQPYPGIFAYFLWGLLLTRLRLHARPGHAG